METDTELDTATGEMDDYSQHFMDGVDSLHTLTDLNEFIETKELAKQPVTHNEAKLINVTLESIQRRLQLPAPSKSYQTAMENYRAIIGTTKTDQLALESQIKETASKIWTGLVAFLKKMKDMIVAFFKKVWDFAFGAKTVAEKNAKASIGGTQGNVISLESSGSDEETWARRHIKLSSIDLLFGASQQRDVLTAGDILKNLEIAETVCGMYQTYLLQSLAAMKAWAKSGFDDQQLVKSSDASKKLYEAIVSKLRQIPSEQLKHDPQKHQLKNSTITLAITDPQEGEVQGSIHIGASPRFTSKDVVDGKLKLRLCNEAEKKNLCDAVLKIVRVVEGLKNEAKSFEDMIESAIKEFEGRSKQTGNLQDAKDDPAIKAGIRAAVQTEIREIMEIVKVLLRLANQTNMYVSTSIKMAA